MDMLFESELKVLGVLWDEGDMIAKDLTNKLRKLTGWQITTSYTVIKRCVAKGLVERVGINFMCRALITREEAREHEIKILTDKMFNGSLDLLLVSLLRENKMEHTNLLRSG